MTFADPLSLVSGDLAAGSWVHEGNLLWQFAGASADGFQDACQLSGGLGGTGRSYHLFCVPFGCTSVLVSFAAQEAAGKDIRVRVMASDLTTVVATTSVALTASSQTVALPATVIPGATFAVSVETSDHGQVAAPVFTRRVTVRPTVVVDSAHRGIFSMEFVRFGVDPSLFGATSYPCTWDGNGQFLKHDGYAELSFLTDADRIVVESWTTAGSSPSAQHAVLVDGRPWKLGTVWPAGAALEEFQLPVATGVRLVTVRSGYHQGIGTGGPFIRAIYLPQRSNWTPLQPTSNRRMVIVGDSITMGGSSAVPAWEAYAMAVRRGYPGAVLVDAYNGRSLYADAQTAALQKAWAQRVATVDPTDIYWTLGINDHLNSFWNAADFGAAYGATLDEFHARMPNARIGCQTPIHAAIETANAAGSTLGNMCDAIQTAATNAARIAWAYYVDGRGPRFPQAADCPDGIHPSTGGHRRYGDGVLHGAGVL